MSVATSPSLRSSNRPTSNNYLGLRTDWRGLRLTWAEAFEPDPPLLVSEWADQHRILPETSAEPGPWRTDRVPYLRAIMDALSPSHPAEIVAVMKGAQLGFTEAGLNWIGYIIQHTPGLVMLVLPTTKMVQRNTTTRIDPMIEASPSVSERVVAYRSRESGNSMERKRFVGGELVMTGANSAAGLRSTPVRFLFLDEIDAYPHDADGEGDPVELAHKRTVTFGGRKKEFRISTPTKSGSSRIENDFERSDKQRYFVPCLACGHEDWIRWEHIHWEKDELGVPMPETARYVCSECGHKHTEGDKAELLARGEWRATIKPGVRYDKRIIGFHISALYSPFDTWESQVEEFLKAKDDPTKLQVFANTVWGEPWAEKGEVPEWERIYLRREPYEMGKVPREAAVLTCGVDVQADRIEYEICGWGKNDESWSIEYGVIEGETSTKTGDAWTGLAELLDRPFETVGGHSMLISAMAVDEGYNTQTVRDWARAYLPGRRVIVVKGQDHGALALGLPTYVDVNAQGKRIKRGMRIYPTNVSTLKAQLYGWLRSDPPTDEALEAGSPYPAGYCHFPEYDEEYFRMLTAEQQVRRMIRGYPKWQWEKVRDRNEALDCRNYNRAAFLYLKLDRWADSRWAAEIKSIHGASPEQSTSTQPTGRSRRRRTVRSSYMG